MRSGPDLLKPLESFSSSVVPWPCFRRFIPSHRFCQERQEKGNSNSIHTCIYVRTHSDKSLHLHTQEIPFHWCMGGKKRSLPRLSVPPDVRCGCVFFLPHVNLNIVAAVIQPWIHAGLLPEHRMQCIVGAQKDFCPPPPPTPHSCLFI